jgi:hypothetical protein
MQAQSLAELFQASAAAIAATRLIYLGLSGRQPALLTFLILDSVSLLTLGTLNQKSHAYFYMYVVFDALHWVVSIFVVREIFELVLERYPGIKTTARWAMYGALVVALLSSVLITFVFWGSGPQTRGNMFYVLVADRSIVFTLSFIVISILLVLSRYPLDLNRNTYVSSIFFSIFFLSDALVTLIDSLETQLYSSLIDTLQVGFAALCFAGWAIVLQPAREAATVVKFQSPEDHELLQQLESLNRLLSRVGRQ